MSHSATDYLALAQALTDGMADEVSRMEANPSATLDRARFAAAINDAGFSPLDFPLAPTEASDAVFGQQMEATVSSLADISWLVETFGGTDDSLATAMRGFFDLPNLPVGLPRPTPA